MKLVLSTQQEKIVDIEMDFVDKIADNMNAFGVQGSLGYVLGMIYMNRAPMTLDELAEATGMSKTRMSQIVREMIDMNIAELMYERDVRKNLYQVENDYYDTFISIFTSTWKKAIDRSRHFERRVQEKIDELKRLPSLSEENEQKVNELLAELHEWSAYYDWIRRVNDFFESGEIFRHVPKRIYKKKKD